LRGLERLSAPRKSGGTRIALLGDMHSQSTNQRRPRGAGLIRLSRSCLLAAALLIQIVACDLGRTCTDIGCLDGLIIQLKGNFELGKTYDLQIDTITTMPEVVPVMSCSVLRPAENQWDVRCRSSFTHTENLGNTIQIRSTEIKKMMVTVSSGGAMLGQQMLEASYTSKEINGEGCGTCTSGVVDVTVP
jgi:hypothetical protein